MKLNIDEVRNALGEWAEAKEGRKVGSVYIQVTEGDSDRPDELEVDIVWDGEQQGSDVCPGCGGSFEATGGRPISGDYTKCQMCYLREYGAHGVERTDEEVERESETLERRWEVRQ